MSDFVTLFEMSPRDGLQNESSLIETKQKIELVNRLSECGFAKIETASFVSPKWVPQMADSAQVMQAIWRKPGVRYTALTPNFKGFEQAIEAQVDEIAVFASASEGFSQANINCSISDSLERFKPVIEAASQAMLPVRGYLSCVIRCPYDGDVAPQVVAETARKLRDLGCYEVSLGDTIGAGTPQSVNAMLDAVLESVPASELAGHFHDTNGQALDNIDASLERGLRVFDASAGGLGGCPYAPGAAGNVATEAVVERLHAQGFRTGINVELLNATAAFASSLRGQ